MPLYNSSNKKPSGVISYKPGKNFIEIQFAGWLYTYTYSSAGKKPVEEMKKLAAANNGLSTFISKHKPPYEKKEKLY